MTSRALLALLLVSAAVPAAADEASEALLENFVAGIDASAGWSASATNIRSEAAETIAEGLVFTREEPHVSVSVERLRLRGLEEGEDGGFTAAEIEMSGGAVVSEMLDYSVPSATASDVSVPSVAEISFNPHHLMTFIADLYSVMAQSEFSKLSVPEVTTTQRLVQQQPGGTPQTLLSTVVYRDLTSTGLRDGVLENVEFGPLIFDMNTPESGQVSFEIASAGADRTDIGAAAHIFNASRYRDGRGDGIWRPLVSRVRYSGLSGRGPDGTTFGLDEVAIENIDGRQPEEPFTHIWDRLLDPTVPEDAKSDLALDAVRNMYQAWRVATIRVDGISVEAPSEQTSFSLGGLTISGLSNEGIDSFIMKALRGEGPGGFGALESLEFAGFTFPNLDGLMQLAALETDVSPLTHEETMRTAFAALPRLEHFSMRGIAGGENEAQAVRLETFSLDLRDWNALFAQATDVRLEGLDVPKALMELDPQASAIVDKLGWDRFVFGMSLSDRWDSDAGTDEATWTASLKDAMDVEISYRLTGLTEDWVMQATAAAGKEEDSEAALMRMLADIALEQATLQVTDRSLLDRGFGIAAEMQGLAVEGSAYREQMRGALPFLLSAVIPSDLAKLVSEPLQNFLAGNQTLVAEIKPAKPIPVTELAGAANLDPSDIPALLGLTLRSEAAAAAQ
ncbi:MAG TPA: hypothetical protein VHG92_02625 [Afifellaceae bacterium]|nr:hypothetical protein [Afifellaceae bacterium]